MDNGELYKSRLERQKREEAERLAAIERDNTPYDPGNMEGRMPMACGVIVAFLFAGAVITAAWLVVKLFRGG